MAGLSEEDVMSLFPTGILLAVDGSPASRGAGRMAVELSNGLDSELHVVYVESLPGIYSVPEAAVHGSLEAGFYEQIEEEAREKVAELSAAVERMGGTVAGSHALTGRADTEIVALGEELGAGLLVLGNRGLGLMKRVLIGSVSDSVVSHAHCPVLVVRGDERGERGYLPGRILLAVDGSHGAEVAARAAVEISGGTGSELHLVYVMPAASQMAYPSPYTPEREGAILEQARTDARSFVDRQAEQIEDRGGEVAEAHLTFGRADEEIVRLSEELEASLIVTGSRGLGGVRRALMGSVSNSVVRHAHCPVLIVRPEDGGAPD